MLTEMTDGGFLGFDAVIVMGSEYRILKFLSPISVYVPMIWLLFPVQSAES